MISKERVRTLGFALAATLPVIVEHEFEAVDGYMRHYIDGTLRATVPPAGLADYGESYPACLPVIKHANKHPARSANVLADTAALANVSTTQAQHDITPQPGQLPPA